MSPEEDTYEQVALLSCRHVGSLLWERKHAVLSLQQRSCQKEITRDDNVVEGGVDEDGTSCDFVFFSSSAAPLDTTSGKVVGGGDGAIVIYPVKQ